MNTHALLLGTAKVDITPNKPVPLTGFATRNNAKFTAIDSRLYAKLFYFREFGETGSSFLSLVVCADLLNWDQRLADRLRDNIAVKWDIPKSAVILTATHNHSGPATMFGIGIGDPDPEYIDLLEHAVLDGVGYAQSNAEPVRLDKGAGVCPISVNRRSKVNGEYVIAPNFEGIADKELNVIRFSNFEGETKAIWLHYACHPVNSRENIVSSEFSGHACETIERTIGGNVVVAFLQGTCGEINPNSDSGSSGIQATREIGDRMTRTALSLLDTAMEPLNAVSLECERSTAELPYRHVPSEEELERIENSGTELERNWAAFMRAHPERLKPSATFEIVKLSLADRLSLLFMNGELVIRYGLFAKQISDGTVLPVGYSHGMIGYVTTKTQLEEGGYEPVESTLYLGLPSPFDHITESIVLDSIQSSLAREAD
ncbi:neutral/alkaline non-lysosomal ceramidase N-terminal domain-containing protein [Paenibacillus solisilvae]|uniref:Neutral/alkaline non-lysosomal ceramidase N-terminal domain-containing protein n=1 Tax=Paenibacillus solisilvae TaxID=2486751 RepID=A0ABW0W276_9BACL